MVPGRGQCLALAFAFVLVACASTTDTPPPGGTVNVATVNVTPVNPVLVVGDNVQLSAVTLDSVGGVLTGRTVTWSSNNAPVATVVAGLVTAVSAGTATITATSETRNGSVTVTVNAAPPPPPNNNECASPQAGWIWCDDFESDRSASYFEVDLDGGNFARVAGVGFNGSTGYRAHWTVGDVSVGSLHLAIGKTPQAYMDPVDAGTQIYRDIYWRVYVRRQPGWTGGGADKLSRAFSFASTTSFAQAMIAHVWSGNAVAVRNFMVLDPARGTDAAGNLVTTQYNDFANLTFLGATTGATALFSDANAGTWYCVEARARLNDPGQSNGIQQLWINGTLDAEKTGLNFLGSFATYGINAVYLENFWNAGSPAVQDRYLDRFVVSTQRINC